MPLIHLLITGIMLHMCDFLSVAAIMCVYQMPFSCLLPVT